MGSCTHGSYPFFLYSLHKGGSPDVDSFGKRHPAGHLETSVAAAANLHRLNHPEQLACKRPKQDKQHIEEVR
jgi:hypothetical protein